MGAETDADRAARLDRELEELLQELRAVIPGAQVLTGLLMTVAFTNRFRELGDGERYVFYGTFVSALVALVLLLAPAAFHRLRFRRMDTERFIRVANREMVVALGFVGASLGGAAYVFTSLVIDRVIAAITCSVVMAVAFVVWWMIPVMGRRDEEPGPRPL